MPLLTASALGKAVATLVLGLVVGAVGTVMHRWHQPWGVVLCLALVVAAAVTTRGERPAAPPTAPQPGEPAR